MLFKKWNQFNETKRKMPDDSVDSILLRKVNLDKSVKFAKIK